MREFQLSPEAGQFLVTLFFTEGNPLLAKRVPPNVCAHGPPSHGRCCYFCHHCARFFLGRATFACASPLVSSSWPLATERASVCARHKWNGQWTPHSGELSSTGPPKNALFGRLTGPRAQQKNAESVWSRLNARWKGVSAPRFWWSQACGQGMQPAEIHLALGFCVFFVHRPAAVGQSGFGPTQK